MSYEPDDGLRQLFHSHLKKAQWTPIETGAVKRGVPDSEYIFPGSRLGEPGFQGWIEFKATSGSKVTFQPGQVAWLTKRWLSGGRAFVAIRVKGTRLVLVPSQWARLLDLEGVKGLQGAQVAGDWVAPWPWGQVQAVLCK